ncbi:MAG: carbohydrate binding family 9 domain-containing protein [Bacteroidia bacterium]|nr:carbohydrate binding family 9 domain-containing protein [Bacteroidia bacterium]
MKYLLSFIIPVLYSFVLTAQVADTLKHYPIQRTDKPPKIDGDLNDECWSKAEAITDFIQKLPVDKAAPTQKTDVRLLYDDYAIYIYAYMYDTHPDSILRELGSRDYWDLNADAFSVKFDTYNSRQDAFVFGVSASGLQSDNKLSDYTYNAVWHSHVRITDKGWCAEISIPYSAIRFPNKPEQEWAFQINREIRRNREALQWAYIPNGETVYQKFWGTITGIKNIKPPVRLSVSPYLAAGFESNPEYNSDGSVGYTNVYSYNAGADIKYGLNESFTLDMILFPEFGQVASDNKVKNLSYREITYGENRAFFNEGTELFSKNMMFYSRRIGKTPTYFYSVSSMIDPTDKIIKNPNRTNLLNAFKISGRTESKLGIGILNAVTGEMNAIIEDSAGNRRKLLTEPFANYNIVVFDQQLKNNSNVYFMNTNVMRDAAWNDANVTAVGFKLENKKNTLVFEANGGASQIYTADTVKNYAKVKFGPAGYFSLRKQGGHWEAYLNYLYMSREYDPSDLGYQQFGNFGNFETGISHRTFEPGKVFRQSNQELGYEYAYNLSTGRMTNSSIDFFFFGTLLNYFSVYSGGAMAIGSSYDYYEPRVEGMYWRNYEWYFLNAGFSSDYRKKLAVDGGGNFGNFMPANLYDFKAAPGAGFHLSPRFRFSNRFTMNYSFNWNRDPYNPGFANFDSAGNVIFGARDIKTISNGLSLKYTFKNDMQFFLSGRHYWTTGHYLEYWMLNNEGMLDPAPWYTENNDYSFTAFNIDATFYWQFAPGSMLTVSYKNSIYSDELAASLLPTYFDYLERTFESPQTNTLSVKVSYYLDYNHILRKRISRKA